jgi:hypothetical protein
MKRTLMATLVLGVVALTSACTPREVALWHEWFAEDPDAAMEFAHNLPPQASNDEAPPVSGNSVWDRLAQCESGGNWKINTGNGYFGGLQFLPSTWRSNGGTGMPHEHSREEQIRVAENLRANSGFAPWPACSRKLGLR